MEDFQAVEFQSLGAEVDRHEKVLRGYVVAQEGDFKDKRGAFDVAGLEGIARTINAGRLGLKSRFGHPEFEATGLGRFLGRSRQAVMGTAVNEQGQRVAAVRANLYFDPSSFKTPHGDLATYVMELAESDAGAISSSLIIHPRVQERGPRLAPLWFVDRLKASDIVEEGAAVDRLLRNNMPGRERLAELMSQVFDDEAFELVKAEATEWLDAYLLKRFGEQPPPEPTPRMDEKRKKMEALKR